MDKKSSPVLRKGQVCYVQKYGAGTKSNGRPAVIISGENRIDGNVIVCFMTKNSRNISSSFVPVTFGQEKLSFIIPAPKTVSIDRIMAPGPKLTESEIKSLDSALRDLLDL